MIMTKFSKYLFLPGILFFVFHLIVFAGKLPAEEPRVQITYIANAGVLIESEEIKILIDGLHRPYREEYRSLDARNRQKIEHALPPFENIDLILITHIHGDHFHPLSVAGYLENSPSTYLVASKQTIDSIRSNYSDLKKIKDRIIIAGPTTSIPDTITIRDVKLTAYDLAHSGTRFSWIRNIGFLIHVHGNSFFHPGDAGWDPVNFALLALRSQQINYAFIPDWYFLYDQGQMIINQIIRAEQLFAIHINTQDEDATGAQIIENYPKAIPLIQSLSTIRLPLLK